MDLLTTLVLGSYVFTAGAYIWAWRLHREVTNHQESRLRELEQQGSVDRADGARLERRVQGLEDRE